MHTERLLRVAELLERLPTTHNFDLTNFAENREQFGHGCGTSACACGYAALDPSFQAEGFRLVSSVQLGDLGFDLTNATTMTDAPSFNSFAKMHPLHRFTVAYGDETGLEATRTFFDIGDLAFDVLFTYEKYEDEEETTAIQVAARIREFVASGGDTSVYFYEDDEDLEDDMEPEAHAGIDGEI